MVERKEIEACFSELQWIKDKNLREKVVDVWKKAADKGGWGSLDDVPFTLLIEHSGLLTDHTKRIAKLARSVMETREEELKRSLAIIFQLN